MISGVTVTVIREGEQVKDRFGNLAGSKPEEEPVEGVLVSPGATADMEASRPEGITVALTLHFPKGYAKPLERCLIRLPEPWKGLYRVVGNPLPYIQADTPGRWDRPVEVEVAHG